MALDCRTTFTHAALVAPGALPLRTWLYCATGRQHRTCRAHTPAIAGCWFCAPPCRSRFAFCRFWFHTWFTAYRGSPVRLPRTLRHYTAYATAYMVVGSSSITHTPLHTYQVRRSSWLPLPLPLVGSSRAAPLPHHVLPHPVYALQPAVPHTIARAAACHCCLMALTPAILRLQPVGSRGSVGLRLLPRTHHHYSSAPHHPSSARIFCLWFHTAYLWFGSPAWFCRTRRFARLFYPFYAAVVPHNTSGSTVLPYLHARFTLPRCHAGWLDAVFNARFACCAPFLVRARQPRLTCVYAFYLGSFLQLLRLYGLVRVRYWLLYSSIPFATPYAVRGWFAHYAYRGFVLRFWFTAVHPSVLVVHTCGWFWLVATLHTARLLHAHTVTFTYTGCYPAFPLYRRASLQRFTPNAYAYDVLPWLTCNRDARHHTWFCRYSAALRLHFRLRALAVAVPLLVLTPGRRAGSRTVYHAAPRCLLHACGCVIPWFYRVLWFSYPYLRFSYDTLLPCLPEPRDVALWFVCGLPLPRVAFRFVPPFWQQRCAGCRQHDTLHHTHARHAANAWHTFTVCKTRCCTRHHTAVHTFAVHRAVWLAVRIAHAPCFCVLAFCRAGLRRGSFAGFHARSTVLQFSSSHHYPGYLHQLPSSTVRIPPGSTLVPGPAFSSVLRFCLLPIHRISTVWFTVALPRCGSWFCGCTLPPHGLPPHVGFWLLRWRSRTRIWFAHLRSPAQPVYHRIAPPVLRFDAAYAHHYTHRLFRAAPFALLPYRSWFSTVRVGLFAPPRAVLP